MTFHIYNNTTRDRERIHRSECSVCNNGAGYRAANSGKHGHWIGPIASREEDFPVAKSLGRKDMKPCGACDP
jgi:hypothetical protein